MVRGTWPMEPPPRQQAAASRCSQQNLPQLSSRCFSPLGTGQGPCCLIQHPLPQPLGPRVGDPVVCQAGLGLRRSGLAAAG